MPDVGSWGPGLAVFYSRAVASPSRRPLLRTPCVKVDTTRGRRRAAGGAGQGLGVVETSNGRMRLGGQLGPGWGG